MLGCEPHHSPSPLRQTSQRLLIHTTLLLSPELRAGDNQSSRSVGTAVSESCSPRGGVAGPAQGKRAPCHFWWLGVCACTVCSCLHTGAPSWVCMCACWVPACVGTHVGLGSRALQRESSSNSRRTPAFPSSPTEAGQGRPGQPVPKGATISSGRQGGRREEAVPYLNANDQNTPFFIKMQTALQSPTFQGQSHGIQSGIKAAGPPVMARGPLAGYRKKWGMEEGPQVGLGRGVSRSSCP